MNRRELISNLILTAVILPFSQNTFSSSSGVPNKDINEGSHASKSDSIRDKKVIAFVIYPYMTPLDIIGPVTVLQNHGFDIEYVYHSKEQVPTEIPGMNFMPTTTFDELDKVDILCVTGTHNPVNVLKDKVLLNWLYSVGKNAQYVTSVCTGAVILAASGLLDGYRASTHWTFNGMLKQFGISVSDERVTIDRNRITGGGVTAGIDFGLVLLSKLKSKEEAELMQLLIQYDPMPPFDAGSPKNAGERLTSEAIKITNSALERENPNFEEVVNEALRYRFSIPSSKKGGL